jgi:tetratricopeptide (TPR) repeat protein
LLGAPAEAGRAHSDELNRIDNELIEIEGRMDRLSLDFTQRRGLIGAAEARQRYEDAVYSYLIGEYETAAITFFALVESEALITEELDLDSEWYLAECLFEMNNYVTAIDAYEHIVDTGASHPFFVDAVRRQLEVYGLTQDSENFQDLYRRYILSGLVSPTDQIKYTVAKSFYRQGPRSYARAKGLFSELLPDSLYFSRARYFMGTIMAAEGDLQAARAEFEKAAEVEPSTSTTREVQQLAWLAQGRLSYELGDYLAATGHYQKLDSSSDYYADQLYELVWTYIKQENWIEALTAIEIFLIAYPEHRYTMQLQITQGHLHMKESSFEKALVSYESVVDTFTPVQETLDILESERDSAAQLFQRMSTDEAFDNSISLPAFAVDMLVEGPNMSRAVTVNQELFRQRSAIDYTQKLMDEVQDALTGSGESIGTFSRGRAGLDSVRERTLGARSKVLHVELDYLLENAPERYVPELRTIQDRFLLLASATEDVQGAESAGVDAYRTYLDQVREVQTMAFEAQQLTVRLTADAAALRRQMRQKTLSEADTARVNQLLAEVTDELTAASERLERLQSETTRRQVMRTAPKNTNNSSSQLDLIARDYEKLHRQLATYWQRTDASDRIALQTQANETWTRLAVIDGSAERVRIRLEQTEGQEIALLRQRLIEEQGRVGSIDTSLVSATGDAGELAALITQEEFGRLKAEFSDTIMRADVGIVDVYWIRKTEVSDESERLRIERADQEAELRKRFEVIHQKLENQEQ